MKYQVDFLLTLKLKKYAILGYAAKYFYLLIVMLGIHCYIVFVGSAICELGLKQTIMTPRRLIQLESCIN